MRVLAARLRTHVSTPLGGEGVESIDEGETVINNRIGVAYCARLPIPHPSLSPPYSRISRAIKHVRPFIGPCTFTECVCIPPSCPDVARIPHSSSGGDRSINYLAGLRQGDKVGRWTWFIPPILREQNHHIPRAIELPRSWFIELSIYIYIYTRRMDLVHLLDPSWFDPICFYNPAMLSFIRDSKDREIRCLDIWMIS